MVGFLLTVLLQIVSWFRQWKKFENQSIFDEVTEYDVKAYKKVLQFFGPPGIYTTCWRSFHALYIDTYIQGGPKK